MQIPEFDPNLPHKLVIAYGENGEPVSYMQNLSPEEIAAQEADQADPATPAMINLERDRRIEAGATFTITGLAEPVRVSGREVDRQNLQSLAFGAMLRQSMGDTVTTTPFRDESNVTHVLAPAQVLELWQKAAAYVSEVYAKSWLLKAMDPIPDDFRDDTYWP